MGLINYQNIDNNTPATANIFNQRFGQIVNEMNGNLDASNLKDGAVTLAKVATEVYTRMWPIGSLYFNATDNTNPSVLLGFGTWVAALPGRTPVGVALSGTFASAGTNIGTEQETLTVDQIPAHSHSGTTGNAGNHNHYNGNNVTVVGSSTLGLSSGPFERVSYGQQYTSYAGDHNHGFNTNNTGSGLPHNNIQPSTTVYVWQRVG